MNKKGKREVSAIVPYPAPIATSITIPARRETAVMSSEMSAAAARAAPLIDSIVARFSANSDACGPPRKGGGGGVQQSCSPKKNTRVRVVVAEVGFQSKNLKGLASRLGFKQLKASRLQHGFNT